MAELLLGEIVTGLWPVDGDLPPERELMLRFQVSRPTYRESLRLLESQGLIKRKRGAKGGARILRPSTRPVARYAGAYLQSHGATGEDVWQTILIIEPAAMRAIARIGDRDTLAEMRAAVDVQRSFVDDLHHFMNEEWRFRELVFGHCGSVTLGLLGAILGQLASKHSQNINRRLSENPNAQRHCRDSIATKDKLLRFIEVGAAEDAGRLWAGYLRSALRRTLNRAQDAGLLQLYLPVEEAATEPS